jgi:hypothetical protein
MRFEARLVLDGEALRGDRGRRIESDARNLDGRHQWSRLWKRDVSAMARERLWPIPGARAGAMSHSTAITL